MNGYATTAANYYQQKASGDIDTVIINNIIISPGFRSDFISPKFGGGSSGSWKGGVVPAKSSSSSPESVQQNFFSYGAWKNPKENSQDPAEGDNQFLFTNYLGLTPLEKTSLKYIPCGSNSLCLKTRSGIYTFPLHVCNKNDLNDIKDIQLYYHGGDDWSVLQSAKNALQAFLGIFGLVYDRFTGLVGKGAEAGLLYDSVQSTFKTALGYKSGDFYAASPCSIVPSDDSHDIKITEKSCSSDLCDSAISYPLYRYDSASQKIEPTGRTHYECTDWIGHDIDTSTNAPISGNCVVVDVIQQKDGYCWTFGPPLSTLDQKTAFLFLQGLEGTGDLITQEGVHVSTDTAKAVRSTFGLPIPESTSFVSAANSMDNAIVLKPTQTALKIGSNFFEAMDRKFGWGWP